MKSQPTAIFMQKPDHFVQAKARLGMYLAQLKVLEVTELSFAERRKVFVSLIGDFEKGLLGREQVCMLGEELQKGMKNMDFFATKLGDVFQACNDYLCDMCKGPTDEAFAPIWKYYQQNKSLALDG